MARVSGFIPPMLPTLVDEPPSGDDWSHEIKFDGYRTQIVLSGADGKAYTRNGFDWTERYSGIVQAAREAIGRDCHLDGEVIVQNEAGKPDFHSLRREITRGSGRLIFYGFDLLSLDGRDLRGLPCEERRSMLGKLIGTFALGSPIQFSESFYGDGRTFFEHAEKMSLEGIVSKQRQSLYRSGRTRNWVKVKAFEENEFLIVGYDRTPGKAATLLAATEEDGKLRYVGRVMVTLSGRQRDKLWRGLEKIRVEVPPLPEIRRKSANWVQPEMRIRVRHLRGEEMLRHAILVR